MKKDIFKKLDNSNKKTKKKRIPAFSRSVKFDEGLQGFGNLAQVGQLVPLDGLG